MVTNLKEGTKIKCQQYWPETGTKNFGPFQVTISDEQSVADYTTRTLLVEVCVCVCVCLSNGMCGFVIALNCCFNMVLLTKAGGKTHKCME